MGLTRRAAPEMDLARRTDAGEEASQRRDRGLLTARDGGMLKASATETAVRRSFVWQLEWPEILVLRELGLQFFFCFCEIEFLE
ncbi:CCR4-Not complex subunit Not1 [Sesbania bispinosa]|nr:CCR4-Not complex subunit Not1 [Sesbania bispinosa]